MHPYERKLPSYAVKVLAKIRNLGRWMPSMLYIHAGCNVKGQGTKTWPARIHKRISLLAGKDHPLVMIS